MSDIEHLYAWRNLIPEEVDQDFPPFAEFIEMFGDEIFQKIQEDEKGYVALFAEAESLDESHLRLAIFQRDMRFCYHLLLNFFDLCERYEEHEGEAPDEPMEIFFTTSSLLSDIDETLGTRKIGMWHIRPCAVPLLKYIKAKNESNKIGLTTVRNQFYVEEQLVNPESRYALVEIEPFIEKGLIFCINVPYGGVIDSSYNFPYKIDNETIWEVCGFDEKFKTAFVQSEHARTIISYMQKNMYKTWKLREAMRAHTWGSPKYKAASAEIDSLTEQSQDKWKLTWDAFKQEVNPDYLEDHDREEYQRHLQILIELDTDPKLRNFKLIVSSGWLKLTEKANEPFRVLLRDEDRAACEAAKAIQDKEYKERKRRREANSRHLEYLAHFFCGLDEKILKDVENTWEEGGGSSRFCCRRNKNHDSAHYGSQKSVRRWC
jgi:hypothetical protein